MLTQKRAITMAGKHHIGIQLAAQLGAGFDQNSGQPAHTIQLRILRRQIIGRNLMRAHFTFLDSEQIIPPHRSHQNRRLRARGSLTGKVLHKVKKLTRLATDTIQKGQVILRVISRKILIARAILAQTTIKKSAKSGVPGKIVHPGRFPRIPVPSRPTLRQPEKEE